MSRARALLYAVFLLYLVSLSYGFIVKGDIYDYYTFDKATNAILTVNTTPPTKIVCSNGSYSLSLPPGYYVIKVHKFDKGVLVGEGEEEINIKQDNGEVRQDILLFPVENSSIDIKELDYASVSESYFNDEEGKMWKYIAIIVVAFLLYLLVYFWLRKRVKRKRIVMDENMERLIKLLEKERRVNQKDIRKEIKLSDAKISLMIAELEEKGVVKKIKKGRGNIIIYKG